MHRRDVRRDIDGELPLLITTLQKQLVFPGRNND
jgi:hypothetical protein